MNDFIIETSQHEAQFDELTEIYFDHLEAEMDKVVRQIEGKLGSVERERKEAISIINDLVSSTYNNKNN